MKHNFDTNPETLLTVYKNKYALPIFIGGLAVIVAGGFLINKYIFSDKDEYIKTNNGIQQEHVGENHNPFSLENLILTKKPLNPKKGGRTNPHPDEGKRAFAFNPYGALPHGFDFEPPYIIT